MKEIRDIYSSPKYCWNDRMKKKKMGDARYHVWGKTCTYVLVGKREGKRPLGRPWRT
jgi:hypothetical protein